VYLDEEPNPSAGSVITSLPLRRMRMETNSVEVIPVMAVAVLTKGRPALDERAGIVRKR
jgi:hypothetical protein